MPVLVVLAQSVDAMVTLEDRLSAVINHQTIGPYKGLFLGEVDHAVLDVINSQYLHVLQNLPTG